MSIKVNFLEMRLAHLRMKLEKAKILKKSFDFHYGFYKINYFN